MTDSESYDLAVVGAGILGLTSALAAAIANPGHRLLVVDAAHGPAAGASGSSAGLCFPIARTHGHAELVDVSQRAHRGIHRQLGGSWLTEVPIIHAIGRDRGEEFRSALRSPAREVGAKLVESMFHLEPDADIVYLLDDGHTFACDAAAMCLGIARLLEERGSHLAWDLCISTVTNNPSARPEWRLEATQGETFAARTVVLAAGPWPLPTIRCGGDLVQPDAQAATRRKRVSAGISNAYLADAALHMVEQDVFVLPRESEGRSIVSFRRELWDVSVSEIGDPWDGDDERALFEQAGRLLPEVVSGIVGGLSHADLYAPGRLPLVESLAPGLVAVRGGSGSGVRLAPALACLALAALGEKLSASDLGWLEG